jgi:hypothetical protein
MLPNYIGGLTLSNNVTPTFLNIAAGGACSDDNSVMMVLAAAVTKNCNTAWAGGSGSGALDTGLTLVANTWYHVFLIWTATGASDILVSQSPTAPIMPALFTKKRRLGSIRTSGSSQIIPFTQLGDQFLWTTAVGDLTNVSFGTAITPITLSVPPGVKVIALFIIYVGNGGSNYYLVWSPDQTGVSLNAPGGNILFQNNVAGQILTMAVQVRTDTSSRVQFQAAAASTSLYVVTNGWIDNRGK